MKKKNLIIIMLCFVLSHQHETNSFMWWMWTVIAVLWILSDLFPKHNKTKPE